MTIENVYRVLMKLVIRPKDHTDFGAYKCIANNTLGESEKIIHLHRKFLGHFKNAFKIHCKYDFFVIGFVFFFTFSIGSIHSIGLQSNVVYFKHLCSF